MGVGNALTWPPGPWLWAQTESCECDPCAYHAWDCPLTPLYAELYVKVSPFNSILWLDMTMASVQTVIKCAECGKERIARDLDVIYQAPIQPRPGGSLVYPHNIV